MEKIQYLNTLSELQSSGYGQPYPRHGLNLLYWFATQCVRVYNNQMIALCSPYNGDFGFRPFQNKDRLLYATNMPYYELGNLNDHNASSLPEYIRKGYTGDLDDSNTDRIIVCLNSNLFDSIYVTCHKRQWTFDRNQTYRISPQLIRTIRRMDRKDFLRQATQPHHLYFRPQSATTSKQHSRSIVECCSTFCQLLLKLILFVVLTIILLILISHKQ
ncbi:uncharacterized protein LOC118816570 [Colossoma macropomum]|uniref:uncharacterized protein LOC118816570 n=1 Tax=Colossoma macropomum TaxID=42526 RepID=UPI0018643758|nr:uncharacterized protein LOC118816570 [Colossoma macropomum]